MEEIQHKMDTKLRFLKKHEMTDTEYTSRFFYVENIDQYRNLD